jgi:hypothetical protein
MDNEHGLKPRDEIAEGQVKFREAVLGVDLSALPVKPLRELAQGDTVLHEGIWVLIHEYQVSDQGGFIRVKFVLPGDKADSKWSRHLICASYEQFYVPE